MLEACSALAPNRMGYGAMQVVGPGVWGPPRGMDGAIAVLHEAVETGANHIDISDFYGPNVTNHLWRRGRQEPGTTRLPTRVCRYETLPA